MSDAAIAMVEKALEEKNKSIEAKVGNDLVERDELITALKKLKRGSGGTANGGAPATSDEDLIATVGSLTAAPGATPVKSPEIAAKLGVDPRSVSRRLSKFAEAGLISGNKDAGYTGA